MRSGHILEQVIWWPPVLTIPMTQTHDIESAEALPSRKKWFEKTYRIIFGLGGENLNAILHLLVAYILLSKGEFGLA